MHKDAQIDETLKLAAEQKKEMGHEAFSREEYDMALSFYDEAIQMDRTQMSFYSSKGGELT